MDPLDIVAQREMDIVWMKEDAPFWKRVDDTITNSSVLSSIGLSLLFMQPEEFLFNSSRQ